MKVLQPWNTKNYYDKASAGSKSGGRLQQILNRLSKKNTRILDVGCGEGTRLSNLIRKSSHLYGIDASEYAIRRAKKQYPDIHFKSGNAEDLSYKNESFDVVYSAYVLEHLSNPRAVIDEMVRVTKNDGTIVLAAPNYGSPNRSSPVYLGNRLVKLLKGFITDYMKQINPDTDLNWEPVVPREDMYEMDTDTVVEPYARSLVSYLSFKGLTILEVNTCWEEELEGAKMQQKIFRKLAEWNIYPFVYWGPHILVVARKKN